MYSVQIISSIWSEAMGPSYSVRRLAESLAARGVRSEIYTTGQSGSAGTIKVSSFPLDFASIPIASRLTASAALQRALDAAAAEGAVLHGHGLWLMPNLYPAWTAARLGTPLVVSPRGMLAPAALKFSRLRKRFVWELAQKRALERATCLHATSAEEADDIRTLGLRTPIAIIPNGIDVPEFSPQKSRHDRTVLYLGRVHPKKGIGRLIEAWAHIEPAFPDWRLRIVGPSEKGHGHDLERQAKSLGVARVSFEPALFGRDKQAAYQEADLFVLPTQNENFGLVVAEALANATPVICTKGAPWAQLESERCGWWIDQGPEPLATALKTAMSLPPGQLVAMGARGRSWMARHYSWGKIGGDMLSLYRWCRGQADKPPWVLTHT